LAPDSGRCEIGKASRRAVTRYNLTVASSEKGPKLNENQRFSTRFVQINHKIRSFFTIFTSTAAFDAICNLNAS
jgi:hypothetical protein